MIKFNSLLPSSPVFLVSFCAVVLLLFFVGVRRCYLYSANGGGESHKNFFNNEVAYLVIESGTSREMPLGVFFGQLFRTEKVGVVFSRTQEGISLEDKDENGNKKIVIKARKDFSGTSAFVVSLIQSSDGQVIAKRTVLVKVVKIPSVTFRYKADKLLRGKIFVAGDFNSWNSTATPLEGPDKNGYYVSRPVKITSSFESEYKYKFVVDGKWLPDPENPDSSPDGFGGYNSILKVKGEVMADGYWITQSYDADKIRIGYVYGESGAPIDTQNPSLIIATPFSILSYENGDYSIVSSTLSDGNYVNYIDIKTNSFKPAEEIRISGKDVSGRWLKDFIIKFPQDDRNGRWENRVIYFALTDRFFNGDKTNDNPCLDPEVEPAANWCGGDFQGIIKKIKEGYFERLGVSALWISPHIKNPEGAYKDALPPHKKFTGYHGYWPVSFEQTDPHFGTLEELKQLVKEAHAQGIKVMFDMVLNHVHQDNKLYKEHPEWFSTVYLPDGRKNLRLFDERPEDTWFDEFLPDFDYSRDPSAIDYIVSNCIYWIKETNCDGFRLDAVKHIPMDFWLKLRLKIRQEIEIPTGKKFYLVGESISSREKIMEYVGFDRLDGQFDFPLYWVIKDVFAWQTKGMDYLADEARKSTVQYYGSIPSPLIGNHDFARFISFADGSIPPGADEKTRSWTNRPKNGDKESHKKLRLAMSFLLTQPGCVPMIYYGDEIGMPGAGDPDNRRPMKFNGLNNDEKETFNIVARLIKYRYSSLIPFASSSMRTIFVGKDFWAYTMNYFDKEYVIVILNRSPDKPLHLSSGFRLPWWYDQDLANKLWLNILTGKKIKPASGIKVAPMDAMVLVYRQQ